MTLSDFSFVPGDPKLKRKERYPWVFWVVLGIVLCTILHFLLEPNLVPKAHAEEPPHDDAYYCQHLKEYVNGQEFTSYCESL